MAVRDNLKNHYLQRGHLLRKAVEIYVRYELVSNTYKERGCEHTATGQVDIHRPTSRLQFKSVRKLREADKKALDVVLGVAKEKEWKVKVCNLSTFTGKVKATFKGVKTTPTIIIGKHRITGIPKEQDLLSF